ncbi:relaxase/mobilization nuclease domain-containing protein [Pseudomonas asiatica]|uniref:relaxase/mobilization nuclease domain-containing protein n=1 Tax=Pseudomonas asiatica TaxID=2219225 RepID=UPI0037C6C2B1
MCLCQTKRRLLTSLAGNDDDVMEMIQEFDSVETMRRMSIDSDKPIKPVFHAMLSLRPGESLSASQWRSAVQKYMSDLGFDETNQYVAVMHQDKDHQHVHIVANRIRLDETFNMVKDNNERSVSLDSVSEIEDRFGLRKAPKPKDTWGIALTHAEVKASNRDGELPHKHRLIAKIAGAIEHTRAANGDMFDFVRALRQQKVYIHLTLNDDGQPKGISYEFDDKHISGRQLKRSRLAEKKLESESADLRARGMATKAQELESATFDRLDKRRLAAMARLETNSTEMVDIRSSIAKAASIPAALAAVLCAGFALALELVPALLLSFFSSARLEMDRIERTAAVPAMQIKGTDRTDTSTELARSSDLLDVLLQQASSLPSQSKIRVKDSLLPIESEI